MPAVEGFLLLQQFCNQLARASHHDQCPVKKEHECHYQSDRHWFVLDQFLCSYTLSQLSSCVHPAIMDICDSDPRQKRFNWKWLPLLWTLPITDTKRYPGDVHYYNKSWLYCDYCYLGYQNKVNQSKSSKWNNKKFCSDLDNLLAEGKNVVRPNMK